MTEDEVTHALFLALSLRSISSIGLLEYMVLHCSLYNQLFCMKFCAKAKTISICNTGVIHKRFIVTSGKTVKYYM